MSYRFEVDESVAEGLRRIACEQLDKALAELADEELNVDETVHQVRKRCKKLRGLLRLVRPGFDGYDHENACLRDIARKLSDARDAAAFVETVAALETRFAGELGDGFSELRGDLQEYRDEVVAGGPSPADQLSVAKDALVLARERVATWRLSEKRFAAVGPGLIKTYARGREAMERCTRDEGGEQFHEWRKRVKYHLYHLRLVRNIWDAPLKKWAAEVKTLGECLGDDHDLVELRALLDGDGRDLGSERERELLAGVITARQRVLRSEAFSLGARIYAERPKHLQRRFKRYWQTWREDGLASELP